MVLPQACPGFSFLFVGGDILSMVVSGLTALQFVGGVWSVSEIQAQLLFNAWPCNKESTYVSNSVTS